MRSRRGIAGQASVELAGMLALLAVVFVGLHALGLDSKISSAAKSALCSILDSDCGDSKPAPAGDRTSSGTTGDDADGDGVSDADEREAGTDPDTADTDGDGLPDGQERDLGTQPGDQDTDHDGIPDAEEADSGGKLDPTSADTDGDGLTDPEEIAVGTDPDDEDSDGAGGATGDGLTDKEEVDRGTDPTQYDSDGDFMPDGKEVADGKDPLKDQRSLPEKALDGLLDDPFGLGKGTVIKKGPKKLIEKLIKKGGKKGGSKLDEIEDLGERARERRERLEALRKGRKQKADDLVDEACSFAGGTLVLMADGSQRPIAQVRAGDRVIATDPGTGTRSARRVQRVWVHDDRLVPLRLGGEILLATEDHPVWDGGWKPAIRVARPAGRSARGSAFNLTVARVHTYHVGRGETLVHNRCLVALRNFKPLRVNVGANGQSVQLPKERMDHILRRHHPKYWDGTTKQKQTFFDEDMTVDEIRSAVRSVALANREQLAKIGTGSGQVRAVVNGREYTLGVTNGRIGQFFPSGG